MSALHVATASGLRSVGGTDRPEMDDRDVNVLHVDAAGNRWALVDRHELWRDAAGSWEMVARSADHRLNCLAVHGENVWVGASDARLGRLEEEELVWSQSFDAAPGRDEWFTPWGGPPDVRSLTVGDGHLFVNVHVGGILRSDLDGSAWEPTIDIGSDVHEVTTGPGGDGSVVAATAWGLALSGDRGETWEFEGEGLHASYARAVGLTDGALFMTASQGPFGGRAAIYRRLRDGRGFTKCENGLPEWFAGNIDTGCVATSGARVAFGTEDGRVFLSEDEGSSWEQAAADLTPVRWLEFGPD